MENRRILIDTSLVIDYLRSTDKEKSQFIKLFKKNELCLSVISIFELYNGATSEIKKKDIEIICNDIETIDFDLKTAKLSSQIYLDLRNKNKIIEFRDILISATAIQNDLPIATLNKKHFERIDNLQIII
jgi:tRNA(fMet)-specific endonuclease VapC